jgi:hypothetical protein
LCSSSGTHIRVSSLLELPPSLTDSLPAYRFSLAVFFTHLVLAYRTFGVFSGEPLILFWSLVAMAIVDLGLQLASDVLIQRKPFSSAFSSPN